MFVATLKPCDPDVAHFIQLLNIQEPVVPQDLLTLFLSTIMPKSTKGRDPLIHIFQPLSLGEKKKGQLSSWSFHLWKQQFSSQHGFWSIWWISRLIRCRFCCWGNQPNDPGLPKTPRASITSRCGWRDWHSSTNNLGKAQVIPMSRFLLMITMKKAV